LKNFAKLILVGVLVSGTGIASVQTNITHAKENYESTPQTVKLVGTYDASQVDSKTMKQFKEIEKEDNNFHITKYGNKVVVEDKLPNPENKTSSYSADGSAENNTKVINFSDFVGNMDGKDDGKIPNGITFYSGKSYNGQHDGQKVKKGAHVHCNRFNGTKSDHRYWSKKHPRAYVDFYKSDCWYHAKAYKCSSLGKMTTCDGLNNIYRKGVKDCSSWKGKPKHKNWPKTAWYRN